MALILCFVLFLAFDLFLDFITEKNKKSNDSANVKPQAKTQPQATPVAEPEKSAELVEKEKLVSDIQSEITQLSEESAKYNNPSDYAKYSKMQRKMITLQKKLDAEKELLKNLTESYQASQTTTSKPSEEKTELVEEQPPVETSSLENVTGGLVSKNTIITKAIRIVTFFFRNLSKSCVKILPAILIYSLPESAFRVHMDASYFQPLSNYFGEQQGDVYLLSRRIIWVIFSYRTIGRLKKLAKGFSFGKSTPSEVKTQGKQKVE